MLGPLLTIGLSVALGTALGILPGALPRVTNPLRTFAVVAAAAVVGLHFLPHTLEAKGAWGVVVGALSFGAVDGLQWLTQKLRGPVSGSSVAPGEGARNSDVGMGLSYAALLLHRVGDGAAMAATEHGGGVLLALGAHAIPVVALVTLGYRRHSLRRALWRAGSLGLVSAASYLTVTSVPDWAGEHFHGWLDAVASGVLLHIVVHELGGGIPRRTSERALDLLAGLAGALLVLGPSVHDEEPALRIAGRVLELALNTAPALLLGLLAAAGLRVFSPRLRQPRGHGFAMAWLLAAPVLGLEGFALSAQLLGGRFALLQLAGVLLIAGVGGLAIASLSRAAAESPPPEPVASKTLDETIAQRLLRIGQALESSCLPLGAWFAIGLVAAAYAEALIPTGSLATLGFPWVELLIVTVVTVPGSFCAAAAVPLAAILLLKGLSPGVILVGLLLGPLSGMALFRSLHRHVGNGAIVGLFAAVFLAAWAEAWVVESWLPGQFASVTPLTTEPLALTWAALLILGLVGAKNLWSVGIRGWLAASLSGKSREN